jgi:hypothetical protein
MIIIFGEKEYVRTRDRGEFYCRSCNAWRPYAYQIRQRYLTLFFIRTWIPTRRATEYVRCLACGNHFDITALRYNPGAKC